MKVTRTTFEVEGIEEPCINVENNGVKVRISKCYHYLGKNTLWMYEFIDDEYNGCDEWNGDFDSLSDADAIMLAKKYSAYIS